MAKKRPGKGHGTTAPGRGKYTVDDPQRMVDWFEARMRQVGAVERVVTTSGDIKYVQPPARFPTFGEYARDRDVCSQSLAHWREKYPEFAEAYQRCKDMQEIFVTHMGSHGAFPAAFAMLMAKHYCGLKDKTEIEHSGVPTVQIVFDADDREAVEGPADDVSEDTEAS